MSRKTYKEGYRDGYEWAKTRSIEKIEGLMVKDLLEFDDDYNNGFRDGSDGKKYENYEKEKTPKQQNKSKSKNPNIKRKELSDSAYSEYSDGTESIMAYPYFAGVLIYTIIIIINDDGTFLGKAITGVLSGLFWPLIFIWGLIWDFDGMYSNAAKTTLITEGVIVGAVIVFFALLSFIIYLSDNFNVSPLKMNWLQKIYRRRKLLISFFIIILISLTTWLFFQNINSNHQTEWKFKNIRNIYSDRFSVEPGKVYEFSWEENDCEVSELILNGEYYYTLNYFNKPYRSDFRNTVNSYVNRYITNPMKIRVSEPVKLGIVFERNTKIPGGISGDFWSKWFRSFGDCIASTHWTVRDITSIYNNENLLFDNNFYITHK